MNWSNWLNDICILRVMYIQWSTKICYFGLVLSGIGSQQTRLSDVLNLKNLKTMWGIKLIFCLHWSYKKYTILGYGRKHSWPISLQDFLLVTCLTNLNTGGPLLHCTCLDSFSVLNKQMFLLLSQKVLWWQFVASSLCIWPISMYLCSLFFFQSSFPVKFLCDIFICFLSVCLFWFCYFFRFSSK